MRTKSLRIRMSEEEMDLLSKKAIQAGVSKSEYVRRYINDGEAKPAPIITSPPKKKALPKKTVKTIDQIKQEWKPNPMLSKQHQTR